MIGNGIAHFGPTRIACTLWVEADKVSVVYATALHSVIATAPPVFQCLICSMFALNTACSRWETASAARATSARLYVSPNSMEPVAEVRLGDAQLLASVVQRIGKAEYDADWTWNPKLKLANLSILFSDGREERYTIFENDRVAQIGRAPVRAKVVRAPSRWETASAARATSARLYVSPNSMEPVAEVRLGDAQLLASVVQRIGKAEYDADWTWNPKLKLANLSILFSDGREERYTIFENDRVAQIGRAPVRAKVVRAEEILRALLGGDKSLLAASISEALFVGVYPWDRPSEANDLSVIVLTHITGGSRIAVIQLSETELGKFSFSKTETPEGVALRVLQNGHVLGSIDEAGRLPPVMCVNTITLRSLASRTSVLRG